MKRHGFLYDEICSFYNLLKAAGKAQRGKRFKHSTSQFNFTKEKELLNIQDELRNKTYQIGGYKNFYIFDPKKRLISALPYRDRVVQHALCNVIEPIFEKTFVYDSYACRINKGSLKVVGKFTEYCRRNKYALKCDIKTYFASIDHGILFGFIQEKIKDPEVLWLIRTIIGSTPNPGIPIGNLTSQIFANLYLNGFDHFVKEELKFRHYLRYMDDLVFFDDDIDKLNRIKLEIKRYLLKIKLQMHPNKCQIYLAGKGIKFLGYKIFPTHRLIVKLNIKRFKKRVKKYFKLLPLGIMSMRKITCSIQSWLGFAMHADSYDLRRKLFAQLK